MIVIKIDKLEVNEIMDAKIQVLKSDKFRKNDNEFLEIEHI